MRIRLLPLLAIPALVTALAACGPTVEPSPTPTAESTPSSTPSPTAVETPAAEAVFTAATSCTGMLGPLETTLIAEGYTLFSSSDGGGIYFPIEPTQDGGDPFSCWYGKDGVDLSSFELASQAVDQAQHEGIAAVLGGGGFTVTTDGDVVTYVQAGDEGSTPAIVHVLRPDSWLTAFSTFGGADQVTVLTGYLDQVAAQLYS
jgi:hypothetical protein